MRVLRTVSRWRVNRGLPMRSEHYMQFSREIYGVDVLSDEQLAELNSLLQWHSFVVDSQGRRFGAAAGLTKRAEPQLVPDRRIVLLNSRYRLNGRRVLEVGCFEGLHTVALCEKGAIVTAVDARPDNVVKTLVRLGFFGCHARVLVADVEAVGFAALIGTVDWVHHVGVLYHLRDPVSHIDALGRFVADGIMLDTHFALPGEITDAYTVDGRSYQYRRVDEFGRADAFSGMYDHSKWLLIDDILHAVRRAGFTMAQVEEVRNERNGSRALIFARRP